MEPFGLFQFLQSLLNNVPSSSADTEQTAAPTQTEEGSAPAPPPAQNNGDAYLRFIADHDRRMQNTKKR